jgi:hypothetical protein
MSKSKKEILYIFLLGLAVRGFFFILSQNTPGDADCKAWIALNWAKHPYWWHDLVWLPTQFYIMGTVFKITGNILIASKLTSLIFGSLSVIPFAIFARKYLSRRAWILASLFFVFYGLHISLSVASMAEIISNFFLFSSLALLFAVPDGESPSDWRTVLAGLCLLLGNLNRQETWLSTPIIIGGVWYLFGLRKAIIFTAVNSLILVYIAISQFVYHQSLTGLSSLMNMCAKKAGFFAVPFLGKTRSFVRNMFVSPSPIVGLFGFLGLFWALRRRKMLYPAIHLAVLLLFYIYLLYIKEWATVAVARYALTMCSFLIIFAAYAFDEVMKRTRPWVHVALLGVTAITAVGLFGVISIRHAYSSEFALAPRMPSVVIEMARYMRQNIAPETRIVVESPRSLGYSIMLRYSPDGEYIRPRYQVLDFFYTAPTERIAKSLEAINRSHARVLILDADGPIESHVLKKNPGRVTLLKQIEFLRVYRVSGDTPVR